MEGEGALERVLRGDLLGLSLSFSSGFFFGGIWGGTMGEGIEGAGSDLNVSSYAKDEKSKACSGS